MAFDGNLFAAAARHSYEALASEPHLTTTARPVIPCAPPAARPRPASVSARIFGYKSRGPHRPGLGGPAFQPCSTGGRPSGDDSLRFCAARVGVIDRRTFDRRSRLDVIVYACHLRLVNGYHKKTSELLKQADAEAYVDLKTMKHKAGEKIYDAGRKFALVAPRWVFQEAVGVATLLLGPLGSLVDFGLDKALDKGKELINERHRKDPEAADVANGCITPTASGRPRSTASRTRI